MTDDEIIKSLEYCQQQGITSECEKCKINKGCRATLVENALDLINRQKAEISVKRKLLEKAEAEIERLKEMAGDTDER